MEHPHTFRTINDAITYCADSPSFIVFDMQARHFLCYREQTRAACIAAFAAYHGSLPISYHNEVIDGTDWHAIFLDIDKKTTITTESRADDFARACYEFHNSLARIMETARDVYFGMFDDVIMMRDFIVALSINELEPGKLSAHIIIRRSVPHWSVNAQFANQLISALDINDGNMIDRAVYCARHNLRLVGSVKPGSIRRKMTVNSETFLPCPIPFVLTIVCSDSHRKIPRDACQKWIAAERQQINTADTDAKYITQICAYIDAKYGIGVHRFRKCVAGLYCFNRLRPSHCDLCGRTHDHDNTVLISYNERDGAIYESCRKYNSEHGARSLRAEDIESSNAMDTEIREITERVPVIDEAPAEHTAVYDEAVMRDFPTDERTIFIRAPMKIGKTNALIRYIATNYAREDACIVFISFRRTFTSEINARFPGFVSYRDISGDICAGRIIVQVESLHRIVPDKMGTVDLLIMDESESIISQFDSGLSSDSVGDFAVFQWLVRTSGRVIAMDAFLGNRTTSVINRIRGSGGTIGIVNSHRNATGDTYYITSDRTMWIVAMMESINRRERIVVCVTSAREGRALYELITSRTEDRAITIKLYTAETDHYVKGRDFSDVNKYWIDCDVLIFTPTLTAGISFERERFDRLFGYFTDKSCGAQTCVQMMGRVRNISCHQGILCVKSNPGVFPVSKEDITMYLRLRKAALMESIEHSYDNNGLPVIADTDHTNLRMQNIIVANKSRNNFLHELLLLITTPGPRVHRLTMQTFRNIFGRSPTREEWVDADILHKRAMDSAMLIRANRICAARDLSDDEYAELVGRDVGEALLYAMRKFELRRDFNLHASDLTPEFVVDYDSPEIITQFRKLREVFQFMKPGAWVANQATAVAESLAEMQRADRVRESDGCEWRYESHRIVTSALRLLGFRDAFDTKFIPIADAVESVQRGTRAIKSLWPSIRAEFKIKPPRVGNIWEYSTFMTIMNTMLEDQYGSKICKSASCLSISPSSLFTIQMRGDVRVAGI